MSKVYLTGIKPISAAVPYDTLLLASGSTGGGSTTVIASGVTTETSVIGGSFNVAANQIEAGDVLYMKAWGEYALPAGLIQFRFKIGGVTVISCNAIALGGTAAAGVRTWFFEGSCVFNTASSASTWNCEGTLQGNNAASSAGIMAVLPNTGANNAMLRGFNNYTAGNGINVTAAVAVDLTAQLSSTPTGSTVGRQGFECRLLKV